MRPSVGAALDTAPRPPRPPAPAAAVSVAPNGSCACARSDMPRSSYAKRKSPFSIVPGVVVADWLAAGRGASKAHTRAQHARRVVEKFIAGGIIFGEQAWN